MPRLALALSLAFAALAPASPLEDAERQVLAGKRAEAAATVRGALPDPAEAPAEDVLSAARVLLLANDVRSARELLARVPATRSGEAPIAVAEGLLRLRIGDLHAAIARFEAARKSAPTLPLALAGIAAVLLTTDQRDDVLERLADLEGAAEPYPEIEILLADAIDPDADRAGAARATRRFLERGPGLTARFRPLMESYAEWLEQAPAPGPPLGPGKPLVIAFSEVAGTPAATFDLGGKRPATLVLDTGANVTLLDEAVAPEGLVTFGVPIQAQTAGGREKTVRRTLLPRLVIGEAVVENVPSALGTLRALRAIADAAPEAAEAARIDGLISLHRVFPGASLAFDFRAKTLTLRGRGDLPPEARKGRAGLAMFVINGLPHALVSLNDGPPVPFLLDTGANTSSVDESYFADHGLPVPTIRESGARAAGLGGEFPSVGAITAKLRWGKLAFSTDGLAVSRNEPADPAPFEPGVYGTIGNDLLASLNPIFDFDRRAVFLEPPAR